MKGFVAILVFMLAFAVLPATAAKAKSPQTVRVQVNHEKRFGKGRLSVRFVELVEDSRCPTDANCVWAGNAIIKIRVRGFGRTHDLTLDTNGRKQAVVAEGYQFKLVGLTPQPRTNIRINRNGYVATIEVTKINR